MWSLDDDNFKSVFLEGICFCAFNSPLYWEWHARMFLFSG